MARNAADRVTETRHTIMDTIRDNPLPAAMVGIGLGWLFWNGRREEHYVARDTRYGRGLYDRADEYGTHYRTPGAAMYDRPGTMERGSDWAADQGASLRDRAGEMTGRAQGAVSDATGRAREMASDVADRTQAMVGDTAERARSAASDLAHQARHHTHRLEDRVQDVMVESPLVVGAAAVALGLAAGLTMPSSRREAEWMGGTRDQLFDRARDMAQEATGRVQQVAERVVSETQSTVKETVREAAREQGLSGSQAGSQPGAQGGMSASGGEHAEPIRGTGYAAGDPRYTATGTVGTTGTTGTRSSAVDQP